MGTGLMGNATRIDAKEFCPRNCQYLDPKEADQTDRKEHHMCTLLGEILRHEGCHPRIVKHKHCRKDELIEEHCRQLGDVIARYRAAGHDDTHILTLIETILILPPCLPKEDVL